MQRLRAADEEEQRLGPPDLPEPLGESEAFLDFQERLSMVAKVERPVLIVGERGTGKELAAARLHYLSKRWDGPLIALNCAALSPSVLESELFGHEAGAFTGAARRRQGRFEAASEGTLFLDEIGLIPMEVQEKILRVVEYRRFERVGGSHPVEVNTRIIGATNANLATLAHSGKFKRDLLDRLSFEVLFVPPLRVRRTDILLLANHFAARMAHELGRPDTPVLSDRAEEALLKYQWPGNIRELKNVVERAVYRTSDNLIDVITFDPFQAPWEQDLEEPDDGPSAEAHFPAKDSGQGSCKNDHVPLSKDLWRTCGLTEAVRLYELQALREALEESRFHQGEAASLLGMSYYQFRTLYRKYKDELKDAGTA
jgi:psp operon transcriptional activator